MFTEKPTIKQTFMRRLGQVHVPPNHLGIVMRDDNRFGRFLQAGYHPPLNPWNERLIGQFSITLRTIKATEEMRTFDGFGVTVAINVQFLFDPSKADQHHQGEMVNIVLNRHTDSVLKQKVSRSVLYELRNQIKQHTGAELMTSQTYVQLEQRIQRHLVRALNGLGIYFKGTECVFIEAMDPSPELSQAMRQQRMAQLLERHPQVGQQVLWLNTLTEQGNIIYHTDGLPINQQVMVETAVSHPPTSPATNGAGRHHIGIQPYTNKAC